MIQIDAICIATENFGSLKGHKKLSRRIAHQRDFSGKNYVYFMDLYFKNSFPIVKTAFSFSKNCLFQLVFSFSKKLPFSLVKIAFSFIKSCLLFQLKIAFSNLSVPLAKIAFDKELSGFSLIKNGLLLQQKYPFPFSCIKTLPSNLAKLPFP